jgi:hypothetical protein
MTQNNNINLTTAQRAGVKLSTSDLENNKTKLEELKKELLTLQRECNNSGFKTFCYTIEEFDDSDGEDYTMDPYEYQHNQNEISRLKDEIKLIESLCQ